MQNALSNHTSIYDALNLWEVKLIFKDVAEIDDHRSTAHLKGSSICQFALKLFDKTPFFYENGSLEPSRFILSTPLHENVRKTKISLRTFIVAFSLMLCYVIFTNQYKDNLFPAKYFFQCNESTCNTYWTPKLLYTNMQTRERLYDLQDIHSPYTK